VEDLPVHLDSLIAHVAGSRPGGDPLDRLGVARSAAADLGEVADHLIGHFVDDARNAGYSWTQIGDRIGVTKQAARKRFAAPDYPAAAPALQNLLSRFTDRAARCIATAQRIAREHCHPGTDTEHLLLGILADEGIGARAIERALGRPGGLQDLQQEASRLLAPPSDLAPGELPDPVPFTPRATKVMQLAIREALKLGLSRPGTGHLLLGLLQERSGGLAGQVLRDAGVTQERARAQVIRLLAERD
jgi:Clp amino terminal domain, pathogenicity island component